MQYYRTSSFVYFIKINNYVKIGYTCGIPCRLNDINTCNPYKPKLLYSVRFETTEEAKTHERELHDKFSAFRHKGEWFKYSNEIKEYIKRFK